ncbi:hypothetical protein KLER11_gp80 [Pararheinheimera phage vB_PsoM_KLER1-1]|nr:hypothetical protein KLER11_gp80 [Pararheinheimera phage vB_PsoM_KLER1-1]
MAIIPIRSIRGIPQGFQKQEIITQPHARRLKTPKAQICKL